MDYNSLRWVNKTPHTILRLGTDGHTIETLAASKHPVRIQRMFVPAFVCSGSQVYMATDRFSVKNMPDPVREDTLYVVSGIAAEAIKRWNFICPRTDPTGVVRSPYGTITSTYAFITHAGGMPVYVA